jgi:glycerate dehydrogenase
VEAHDRAVKAGQWQASPDWCFWSAPQILLSGKKIGIVGFGRIGRRVGELAHAFGMEVLAFDPASRTAPGYMNFKFTTLDDLFAQADVVSLHCLMNDRNRGFVDRSLIGRMKPGAFFINASRGGLVTERDLADALNSGRIAGAAVDVVSTEPVRPENPLLKAANCVITPHIAWATATARQNLMNTTVANIKAFAAGRPVNVVNSGLLR